MDKYKKILQRFGLSEYEVHIYLALLQYGPRHITDIARDTGYHRPLIYKTLRTLRERGYITPVPGSGKQKYYHITDPQWLKKEIEEFTKQSEHIIDELSGIFHKKKDQPALTIKEGVEEIRAIHSDLVHSLKKGDVYYRYSSSFRNYSDRSKYVPSDYFQLQKDKELHRYVITSEEMKQYRVGNPLRDVVSIPEGFDCFNDNITKLIYGDKVAIIDYNSLSGWIIESARFAEYEKKIFLMLYKLLKKSGQ
ncbi:hypothetical protein HOO68_01445 [Candidatus Gracilibacteria bacterium]|nr:hypothetical protein [Candidatus Gracilibacteria bacterium]